MMEQMIFLFLVYAIIGWFWETPFVSIKEKKYINRGFLRGPYIPIYGFSCMTIILVLNAFEFQQADTIFVILIQILIIAFISVVWEFGTSWVLEQLFKQRWWDYSYKKYNIQGRVSLDFTILFGIGGFLLWRFINPLLIRLHENLNGPVMNYVLSFVALIFVIDATVTVFELIKIKKFITKFVDVKESLSLEYQQIMAEILYEFKTSRNTIKTKIEQLKKLLSNENKKTKVYMSKKIAELENLVDLSGITKRIYSKFPRLNSGKSKERKEHNHEN